MANQMDPGIVREIRAIRGNDVLLHSCCVFVFLSFKMIKMLCIAVKRPCL